MEADNDLDPRIQVELENLNAATDEINKLEIELEEANSTFRILMNESTRRLKVLSKKLGNCIEKARPYYEALEKARIAQIECQKAAAQFQRANEITAAAKETVALAEQRFMSNSHEWQFDDAWQESLNFATFKVMDAESKKAEYHAEHQKKTQIFNTAERKVQQLEERLRRNIQKSRPYFEEKQICQDQLETQKGRVMELQALVQAAKAKYSTALRNLEQISEDIHKKRGDLSIAAPPGPREPGVGAEQLTTAEITLTTQTVTNTTKNMATPCTQLPDISFELGKCDLPSLGSEMSLTTVSSAVSEKDIESEIDDNDEELNNHNRPRMGYSKIIGRIADEDLEQLRQKVKSLAVRPVEGGDGQQQEHDVWENELNATVDKLDHLMMIKECQAMSHKIQNIQMWNNAAISGGNTLAPPAIISSEPLQQPVLTSTPFKDTKIATENNINNNNSNKINKTLTPSLLENNNSKNNFVAVGSLPVTPEKLPTSSPSQSSVIKKLPKIEPLPLVNVSMRELPLLARISNEIWDKAGYLKQRRRSLE